MLGSLCGTRPRTFKVAPPPAWLTSAVGDGRRSALVKPKFKKKFKEMQLKKLLPESKYPFVDFSSLLQWKVVATRFFGGVLATAATTG